VVVSTHDERLLPLADQVVELVPHVAPPSDAPVTVELAPGDVLFGQGDRAERIYVVERGEVELIRVDPDGVEHHLATKVAGEYFGEMGPLFHLARSATARASGAATLTGLTVAAFSQRLGSASLGHLLSPAATGTTFMAEARQRLQAEAARPLGGTEPTAPG